MSSGNRSNWGKKNWDRNQRGGRGRGGFGGRDRGTRGGVNKNYRGHNFGNNRGFRGGRQNDHGGRGDQNFQIWNKTPRDTPGKRLSEKEIGVTEYINDHQGFLGVIKSRYSDFQVSEINLKGEIAKLTDMKPPEPPVNKDVEEDEDLLLNKYNVELLPMDVWDRINKLAVSDASSEKVEVDATGMSKEQRTKIHDAVKKAFGDSIVGSTVGDENKKMVRFEKYRKGVRIDNRVKWVWGGEHVHFVLHKENCDTMDAAQRLAERLRMNLRPTSLGYAGTKDRRAKTSQWFSARKVDPRKLSAAVKELRDIHIGNFSFSDTHLKLGMLKGNRKVGQKDLAVVLGSLGGAVKDLRGIHFGNFSFIDTHVKLGMLKGNHFRIALRNVTADEESVRAACALLKERGFINYYGLQRFGTRADSPTYEIGKSMLKGDFQEAINGILRPRPGPLQYALEQFRDHGAHAALAAGVRAQHSIELRLLKALASQPKDLLGALNKLARNTRLLYIHSYQSMVWNCAVSERIKRFGLQPVAGDLVPLSEVDADDMDEDSEEENDEQDGDDTLDTQNGAQHTTPTKQIKEPEKETKEPEKETKEPEKETKEPEKEEFEKETKDPEKEIKEPKKKKTQKIVKFPVKILTQEDIDSGQFSIFDVIMPLPGHFIDYPPNMVDYYEMLLKKDGLTLELKNKIKSLSMSGAYRRVVTRPIDMSWSFRRYNSPVDDVILSDLDEIRGFQLRNTPDGQYKALLLSMSLPASCYATMALRELLKVDTSGDNQALQNNYHKDKPHATESSEAKSSETSDKVEEPVSCMDNEEAENENGAKRKLDAEDRDAKRAKQDDE